MPFFLILLLIVALAGAGIFFLLRFLRKVQPTTDEVREDIQGLRDTLKQWQGTYAPWNAALSDTLAPKPEQIDQTRKDGAAAEGRGVYVNLVGEPVLGYAWRTYIAPGVNATLYAVNAQHEFVFRFTNKGTEIHIDGNRVGILRKKPGSQTGEREWFDNANKLVGRLKTSPALTAEWNGQDLLALPAPNTASVNAITVHNALAFETPEGQAFTGLLLTKETWNPWVVQV